MSASKLTIRWRSRDIGDTAEFMYIEKDVTKILWIILTPHKKWCLIESLLINYRENQFLGAQMIDGTVSVILTTLMTSVTINQIKSL